VSVVNLACRQVEVFATGRSLVQRSPTDCGVSLCDLETSGMRCPGQHRAFVPETESEGQRERERERERERGRSAQHVFTCQPLEMR
jgi:hypothetical protein